MGHNPEQISVPEAFQGMTPDQISEMLAKQDVEREAVTHLVDQDAAFLGSIGTTAQDQGLTDFAEALHAVAKPGCAKVEVKSAHLMASRRLASLRQASENALQIYQAMCSRPAPSQPPQHAATYQWPVGSTDVLHAPTAGVRILPEPEWKDADGALEAVDALLAALHTSAEHHKLIDLLDQMQRIGRIDADTASGLLDMVERQREQARQQILDGARKPEVEIVSQEPSDAERQVGSMRRLFAAAVRDLIREMGTDGQGHAVAELVRLTQQHD